MKQSFLNVGVKLKTNFFCRSEQPKIRKMRQINVREYRRDNQKLKNGQSIETGNIRYTRRRKTKHNTEN